MVLVLIGSLVNPFCFESKKSGLGQVFFESGQKILALLPYLGTVAKWYFLKKN